MRELRTLVERAFVLAAGRDTIELTELMLPSSSEVSASTSIGRSASATVGDDRERVVLALARTNGNQKEAAKLLGVSRQTLATRLRKYGIGRPRKPS